MSRIKKSPHDSCLHLIFSFSVWCSISSETCFSKRVIIVKWITFFRVNLACFIFQTETKKHLFSLMILFFICQPNSFLTTFFCIEYRFDAYFSMCTKYTLIVLTAPFCNFQKRIHPIFICFFEEIMTVLLLSLPLFFWYF